MAHLVTAMISFSPVLIVAALYFSASTSKTSCGALQTHHSSFRHSRRHPFKLRYKPSWGAPSTHPFSSNSRMDMTLRTKSDEETTDDEKLLESVDISTLQALCEQYSLSPSGDKAEMLRRLREFANQQAELDRQRQQGRTTRVEANLEGKARHTIVDDAYPEEGGDEDSQGYFYFAAAESELEKKQREEEKHRQKIQKKKQEMEASQSRITSPLPPKDVQPNEKGERVVTVYSTTDKNDLTGMTTQSGYFQSDMSMDGIGYQQKSLKANQPEESLIGGPFGDTSGSRRKKTDERQIEKAKDSLRELVRNLLATTGAPAFQDEYEEGDETASNSFASPYGFTGFQSERIPPGLLSESSYDLRLQNGNALKEILSEYEIQAIGHDGMAADDVEKGGGHYREVEKVGSFLDGFRKAEERRVARETSAMLLDRLVKEGIVGLDQMLSGMVREGEDPSYLGAESGQVGELNSALVRYLEDAIREQERRVERSQDSNKKVTGDNAPSSIEEDGLDLAWNVTHGEDGTIIETIDPNNPLVGQMIKDELQRSKGQDGKQTESDFQRMTVQEKMLLLLKLLRDRVKVEAVIGNDSHARNLRILAYCLKARSDEERHQLILDELGMSLDSLDVFSDLVSSSIDYAEARSNDDFMPGQKEKAPVSPLLNVSKLRSIKDTVERIKAVQSWKASGVSQN
ncbi:predicted protein [Thalassiosira pseudonana CCMP1335]|uniref:SAP domain-containing protein n=1 Tax=Thalassiosira pseudonana TaxID=35128 RepID=B8C5H3_THAPS|nr:predicted protein [Thalassiosira pseudonana CCMP1335]EED91118.1 predicted protein [Thalassiosira pseudonana CCMP1335]